MKMEESNDQASDMPLGEALIDSLTELRDALAENPELGVGQELRRILLSKGYKRITLREAREVAVANLREKETDEDRWSDDGGQL